MARFCRFTWNEVVIGHAGTKWEKKFDVHYLRFKQTHLKHKMTVLVKAVLICLTAVFERQTIKSAKCNKRQCTTLYYPAAMLSCSVVPSSSRPCGLQPSGKSARLLWPRAFPSKNTGVGCHFPLHGIFQTQGSNLRLLHWQADSWPLSHLGIVLHGNRNVTEITAGFTVKPFPS